MADATLIPCPTCGATNRLPDAPVRDGAKTVCGRCKTPLPHAAAPLTISDASFAAASS